MPVEFRKDLFADERGDDFNEIGRPTIRQDILGHVTGRTPYYDDHLFEGLLHLRMVRSPHHHARIRSVDFQAAERMPGVVRLVHPSDVPVNRNTLLGLIGFGRDDEPVLATERVCYRGEPILGIIAETERQARDAVAAVRVDWEELPHVLDVEEALRPGAPVVNPEYPNNTFDYHETYDHQKLRFGDVEAAFAEADHVIEGEYQMSPIEQAPLETCGAIAAPETNDRYVCYTATQGLFFSVDTTAKLLDVPSSRLHFIGGTVGGGFGGKVDSQTEPLAVLGAMLTGRPVKMMWDRAEEMQVGAPRGGERWRIKDGVMNDGRIIARSFTGFFDAGAYTRLSSYAVQKATGHLPGPYTIPNVASNVYCVYTNRTPSTAMRGFGITGVDFSIECHMDKVAEQVGMDPISLRILNAYRDGDMKAHRRVAKNCALIESCQVVAEKSGWRMDPASLAASSMRDGGVGWRSEIPATALDRSGLIGDRSRTGAATEPLAAGASEYLPAGHLIGGDSDAAPLQRDDMQIEAERIGHKTDGNWVTTAQSARAPVAGSPEARLPQNQSRLPSPGVRPAYPIAPSYPASTTPLEQRPVGSAQGPSYPRGGPSLPPAASALPTDDRYRPTVGRDAVRRPGDAPADSPSAAPLRSGEPETGSGPAKPNGDAASSRNGPRRSGISSFISGRRRR